MNKADGNESHEDGDMETLKIETTTRTTKENTHRSLIVEKRNSFNGRKRGPVQLFETTFQYMRHKRPKELRKFVDFFLWDSLRNILIEKSFRHNSLEAIANRLLASSGPCA